MTMDVTYILHTTIELCSCEFMCLVTSTKLYVVLTLEVIQGPIELKLKILLLYGICLHLHDSWVH